MLKKTLFGAAVVAAAGFGTFTANQNNKQALLSDLQLDNVEILAEGDTDSMIDHMWKVGNDYYNNQNNESSEKVGTIWVEAQVYIDSNGYGWAVYKCQYGGKHKECTVPSMIRVEIKDYPRKPKPIFDR